MKLKSIVLTLALLGTAITLFYAFENWRGAKAWQEWEQEADRKGIKWKLKDFIPPQIPDDENIAATPVFRRFMNPSDSQLVALKEASSAAKKEFLVFPDIRKGKATQLSDPAKVLAIYAPYQGLFDEVNQALQRPHIRWDLKYEEGFFLRMDHFGQILGYNYAQTNLALAYLKLNQNGEARKVVLSMDKLAITAQSDQYLIGALVSAAAQKRKYLVLWEGLQSGAWSETDLKIFIMPPPRNSIHDFQKAMRQERSSFLNFLLKPQKTILTFLDDSNRFQVLSLFRPQGWVQWDQLSYAKTMSDFGIDDPLLSGAKLLNNNAFVSVEVSRRKISLLDHVITPYSLLSLPALNGCGDKFIDLEVRSVQCRTACALELYRRAHRTLPQQLSDLVPTYLETIPLDIVDEQPLRYVRLNDQDYLLYSIGLNQKDEGGLVTDQKREGDLVWPSRAGLIQLGNQKSH